MEYEEIKKYLGKKVICNMNGYVTDGLFKEISVSKKYINTVKFDVSNWLEMKKITDMEEVPKKKGWWQ